MKKMGKVYSDRLCNADPNIVYLKANSEINNYKACLLRGGHGVRLTSVTVFCSFVEHGESTEQSTDLPSNKIKWKKKKKNTPPHPPPQNTFNIVLEEAEKTTIY